MSDKQRPLQGAAGVCRGHLPGEVFGDDRSGRCGANTEKSHHTEHTAHGQGSSLLDGFGAWEALRGTIATAGSDPPHSGWVAAVTGPKPVPFPGTHVTVHISKKTIFYLEMKQITEPDSEPTHVMEIVNNPIKITMSPGCCGSVD